MVTKRIAIRTDANSEIGTGHFIRCLTLAEELKKNNALVFFVTRGLPEYLAQMLHDRNIVCYSLPDEILSDEIDDLPHSNWLKVNQYQDAIQTLEVLARDSIDWLVVDHYAIDHQWESMLKPAAEKIMVIDDLADRQHSCDLLLDQNYYHDMYERYLKKVPLDCQLLLGPSYALLRDEFREKRKVAKPRDGVVKNILVYFGGFDSDNYTSIALSVISKKKLTVNVDVVVGRHHPKLQEIQSECELNKFNCYVQTERMAELMAHSDLAMCAGGTSVWEAFSMGLPLICFGTANNQRKQVFDLRAAGLLIASEADLEVADFFSDSLEIALKNSALLEMISEKIYRMVDGLGVRKVANLLTAPDIHIRLAHEADSLSIFTWRNHPVVRSNSLSNNEIAWADHVKWFSQRSENLSQPILIGEIEGQPVGVVRFDISDDTAEVSIYLVPNLAKNGLGRNLLSHAERWLKEHHPYLRSIRARVLDKNMSSKRLFQSLQYVLQDDSSPIEFLKKYDQLI